MSFGNSKEYRGRTPAFIVRGVSQSRLPVDILKLDQSFVRTIERQ